MRMHLAACILAWLIASAVSPQDKPDFSGDWLLASPVDAESSAAQTMIVRASFKRESVHGTAIDPPLITLAVERHFKSGVRSELYTIGAGGGVVSGVVGNEQNQQSRFSTTWDGNQLVIDTRSSGRSVDVAVDSEHREVWSLESQGTLLLTVTDRSPGTEPTTIQLTYRRRP